MWNKLPSKPVIVLPVTFRDLWCVPVVKDVTLSCMQHDLDPDIVLFLWNSANMCVNGIYTKQNMTVSCEISQKKCNHDHWGSWWSFYYECVSITLKRMLMPFMCSLKLLTTIHSLPRNDSAVCSNDGLTNRCANWCTFIYNDNNSAKTIKLYCPEWLGQECQ